MTAAARKMPVEAQPAADDAEDLAHGDEWEQEVERRAEEIRSGRVQPVPREEVAARIRAEHGWR
jgi:putative addiction module component (TIGR02574 family)